MMKAIPAFAAVLAASALVVPTVSRAATVNSVRVSYVDLNLATEVGAKVLEKRIAFAARIVCGHEDSRQLAIARATNLCRDHAIADARPAFHAVLAAARNPSVTVLPEAIAVVAR